MTLYKDLNKNYQEVDNDLFWSLRIFIKDYERESQKLNNDYSDSFKITYSKKGTELFYMEKNLYNAIIDKQFPIVSIKKKRKPKADNE